MKRAIKIFNFKNFIVQCVIISIIATRFLLLSPELRALEKHKKKLAPPNVTREISFEERLKNIRDERDKPAVKINKKREQNINVASINKTGSLSNDACDTFIPYFGQYIDPPKLG